MYAVRVLRYRVFEATLARCFLAEFGKARWVGSGRVYYGAAAVGVAAGGGGAVAAAGYIMPF